MDKKGFLYDWEDVNNNLVMDTILYYICVDNEHDEIVIATHLIDSHEN